MDTNNPTYIPFKCMPLPKEPLATSTLNRDELARDILLEFIKRGDDTHLSDKEITSNAVTMADSLIARLEK